MRGMGGNKDELTQHLDPYKVINSEYGEIEQKDWLRKERARIGYEKCGIVTDKTGCMALKRTKR